MRVTQRVYKVDVRGLFALAVDGAMISANIFENDILLLEKVASVEEQIRADDIVTAQINGEMKLMWVLSIGDDKIELKAEKKLECTTKEPPCESVFLDRKDFGLIKGKLLRNLGLTGDGSCTRVRVVGVLKGDKVESYY